MHIQVVVFAIKAILNTFIVDGDAGRHMNENYACLHLPMAMFEYIIQHLSMNASSHYVYSE